MTTTINCENRHIHSLSEILVDYLFRIDVLHPEIKNEEQTDVGCRIDFTNI